MTPATAALEPRQQTPPAQATPDPSNFLTRVRPTATVRLGGVFTLGLGASSDPFEESAAHLTPLSADNAKWLPENCDVVALNAVNITPQTFRVMTAAQPLFVPLLFAYASALFEKPDHEGNVGGWSPQMRALTLRDAAGKEAPYPEAGGHWMDFGSTAWATHWRDQATALAQTYGALGIVAAEMPIDNTFVGGVKLARYTTPTSRAEATAEWLAAARAPGHFLLIPDALGFDALAGHPTLPLPDTEQTPSLSGRLWDATAPLVDGAWVEGWVRPYWSDTPLSETEWERQIEAADRTARNDQVFIAAAAYSNAAELEYALSSYLLAAHRQGRFVFQPMPIVKGQRRDAGYSLAVLRREYKRWQSYFDVGLGNPEQVRHLVPTDGGNVWKRGFTYGCVYVNSTNHRTLTVTLGSKMRRLDGSLTGQVVLPPHSGVVLLYQDVN
jgi:hypothetical protein